MKNDLPALYFDRDRAGDTTFVERFWAEASEEFEALQELGKKLTPRR